MKMLGSMLRRLGRQNREISFSSIFSRQGRAHFFAKKQEHEQNEPEKRVNHHLRVVMPNDPIPKAMKRGSLLIHTCDKGSTQNFICYGRAFSFMSKTKVEL